MKMTFVSALLLACCCSLARAEPVDPYYASNPYSPYPPGCVTLPLRQLDLYGENVARFWSGSMWLDVAHKVQTPDASVNRGLVNVIMYRVGCAEPNRSVILVEFTLPPEWVDSRNAQIVLPSAGGSTWWDHIPFELKAEPNGWGQSSQQPAITMQAFGEYTGGWDDPRRFTWRYVLDVGPVGQFGLWELPAEYYNGRFSLELWGRDPFVGITVEVPATREVLEPNASLPLNGRLTGTWVEDSAADQGFLLTFSNPVPPIGSTYPKPQNSELVVFLSWFTFDSQGDMLWLTGSASFPQGATEVTIPIVQVTHGHFLGSQAAERSTVGNVQLRAKQCNALEVEYDLADLDLGDGSMRLQRLDALEIAGYPCRDHEARLTSLAPHPGN